MHRQKNIVQNAVLSDFTIGGVASVCAAFVTNPFEVVKTRLQLQGELAKRGTYSTPYKGIFGAFVTIAKNEGILGLQKGLIPALYFQFFINSVRFEIYTRAVKNGWSLKKNGELSFALGAMWGAIAGATGAFISSPFFLIKTQLQAQAAQSIAVGYQHKHTSMLDAIKKIYKKGGFFSLWNGATAALPRAGMGSGAQIVTFDKTKSALQKYELIMHPLLNSFCSGIISGSVTAVFINPPDVITTRLYNQPLDKFGRGAMYKGLFDCFMKILQTEGIYGFYKGFWANYFRIGPHSTLVLFFFDQLCKLRNTHFN